MDIAVYVTAAIGGTLIILAGVFSSGGHRDWSIWTNCLGTIVFVISGYCWYQDKVWTEDEKKAAAASVADSETLVCGMPPKLHRKLERDKAAQIDFEFVNATEKRIKIKGCVGGLRLRDKGDRNLDKEFDDVRQIAMLNVDEAYVLADGKVGGTIFNQEPVLTSDLYDAVQNGSKVLIAYCAVGYEDSVGQSRVSTFFAEYEPQTEQFFSLQKYQSNGKRVDMSTIEIRRRPKLVFESARMLEFGVTTGAAWEICFKNAGGGQALVTAQDYIIADIPNGPNAPRDIEAQWSRMSVKACDFKIAPLGTLTKTPPKEVTNPVLVELVNNGAALVCVLGRIEYGDRDGGQHWLHYCLLYDGEKFYPHTAYNDSDSNAFGQKDK